MSTSKKPDIKPLEALRQLTAGCSGSAAVSIDELYNRTVSLTHSYLYYYDNKACKQAFVSAVSRAAMIFFGTCGLVLPLIAPLLPASAQAAAEGTTATVFNAAVATQSGYIALVMAGAAKAYDSTFGGISGHARYMRTRLALESRLANLVTQWQQPVESKTESAEQKRHTLLVVFLEEMYQLICAETTEWHQSIVTATEKQSSAYTRK